jgi:hypothetical protein
MFDMDSLGALASVSSDFLVLPNIFLMDSPEKLQRGESDFYTMEVKKKSGSSGFSDSLGEAVCKEVISNRSLLCVNHLKLKLRVCLVQIL